jgi:hypothetical protein
VRSTSRQSKVHCGGLPAVVLDAQTPVEATTPIRFAVVSVLGNWIVVGTGVTSGRPTNRAA